MASEDHRPKKGPWSTQEDNLLKTIVAASGTLRNESSWVKVAQQMGTRSAKQCRERWHQALREGICIAPITDEEGARISELVLEKGTRWAEIARTLGNRTDNQVKNWYYGRRSKNQKRPRKTVPYMAYPSPGNYAQPFVQQQQPLPEFAPAAPAVMEPPNPFMQQQQSP
ncbi:hypothetical protein NA57DRAFT_35153, partial [Rhizodiscina lignyota]